MGGVLLGVRALMRDQDGALLFITACGIVLVLGAILLLVSPYKERRRE